MAVLIDDYYYQLEDALESKDPEQMAELAKGFYDRWADTSKLHIQSVELMSSYAQLNVSGVFKGELKDFVIRFNFENSRKQISITPPKGRKEWVIERMDKAVEFLGVPMHYLEGMECAFRAMAAEEWEDGNGRGKQNMRLAEERNALKVEINKKVKILGQLDEKIILCPAGRTVHANIPALSGSQWDGTEGCEPHCDFSNVTEKALRKYGQIPTDEPIEVAEARKKYKGKTGLYFGWCVETGALHYVGKATDFYSRLDPKRRELARCRVNVLLMPEPMIHTWEAFFIWLCRPLRNSEVRLSMPEGERFEWDFIAAFSKSQNEQVEAFKKRMQKEGFDPMKLLFCMKEAAAYMSVSYTAISKMIRDGTLEAQTLPHSGNKKFIRREDLDRLASGRELIFPKNQND